MRRFLGVQLTWIVACTIAFAAARIAIAQDAAAMRLPDVLKQVPPNSPAVLIVPHIKRASDDLTRLLEGMDRANLLLGARPIDQIKSITGYNTAIDDNGAAAMIVTDIATTPARVVWMVPTDDAATFLAGNFTGKTADGQAYLRSDGSTMYARVIGSHVLIGDDAATVRDLTPGEGMLMSLSASLRGREIPAIADANLIVIMRKPLIAALRQRTLGEAAAKGMALPGIAVLAAKVSDEMDTLIVTLQGDPLALIARSVAIFGESSTFGVHAPEQTAADTGLARLPVPTEPLALALNIDLAALGGEPTMRDIAAAIGEANAQVPAWLAQSKSMQMQIAPSPAGVKGGLLNGAAIALASTEPANLRDAIKAAMLAGAQTQPPTREAKWTDAQTLADGSRADAYEMRLVNPPAEAAALDALLFGAAGMRGYVRPSADSVVMTFAQRPAILDDVARAAQEAAANADSGYAGTPAVRVMRRWMWAQRDIEGYLGTAQLTQMVSETAGALGAGNLTLPLFDQDAPPIGFALDVSSRRVDGVMIVPAGVAAPLLDEIMKWRPAEKIEPLPGGN